MRSVPVIPKTRVRRSYEYDFDNMTPADWEELQLSTDRLAFLNEAYGMGEKGFPQYYEMDMNACRQLRDDIEQHRDFWFQEIFHPCEADKNPTHVERAVIALEALSSHYYRKRKYEKALDVSVLLIDVLECYRVLVFENPLFRIGQENKTRYRFREYSAHSRRYNAASMLGKKEMTVESFRRCAELELAGLLNGEAEATFIELLKPEYLQISNLFHGAPSSSSFTEILEGTGVEKVEEVMASMNAAPPLTIARLRNEITDDEIWTVVSRAAQTAKKVAEGKFDFSVACPVCASRENLRLCSCGKVAYCSPAHQYVHFQQHKETCKCPVCGSNKNLKMCSGCRQIAFCCQAHAVTYRSEHRKDCKEGGKGKHIGKEVRTSDEAMAELMRKMCVSSDTL